MIIFFFFLNYFLIFRSSESVQNENAKKWIFKTRILIGSNEHLLIRYYLKRWLIDDQWIYGDVYRKWFYEITFKWPNLETLELNMQRKKVRTRTFLNVDYSLLEFCILNCSKLFKLNAFWMHKFQFWIRWMLVHKWIVDYEFVVRNAGSNIYSNCVWFYSEERIDFEINQITHDNWD